jgi:hypothetical protein
MWLVIFAAVVVALVLGEGWRQRRKYGAPSGRPNLVGAGFLELQGHLQPDRKVEVMQAQAKGQEATEIEQDVAGAGKPPRDGNRTAK